MQCNLSVILWKYLGLVHLIEVETLHLIVRSTCHSVIETIVPIFSNTSDMFYVEASMATRMTNNLRTVPAIISVSINLLIMNICNVRYSNLRLS